MVVEKALELVKRPVLVEMVVHGGETKGAGWTLWRCPRII
jgi:hypothetical protein